MRTAHLVVAAALAVGTIVVSSPADATPSTTVTASVTSINFGTQQPGAGTPYTVVLTNDSANQQTLGTAAVSGASAVFTLSQDGCSDQPIAAGATCAVTVTPSIPESGIGVVYSATLSIPVTSGAAGDAVGVDLAATGSIDPPFGPVPGPGYVDVHWATVPTITSATITGPPSGYAIMRGTDPGQLTQLATIDDPVNVTVYRDSTVAAGTEYYYAVQPVYNGTPESTAPALPAIPWQPGSAGTYIPLPSQRILDTRTTLGGHLGPVVAGRPVTLQVTGRGGVPSSGVGTAALNLTGTHASQSLAVTAWAADRTQPNTSVLNLPRGGTRANLITVPVSASGQITITPLSGSLDVIVDVMGFYASAQTSTSIAKGGQLIGFQPERIADTRDPEFGATGPLPAHRSGRLPIGAFGPFDQNVHAAVVNITETGGTAPGYLTAYASGASLPASSTLNFSAGTTNPNMAIVPVGPCGSSCADPSAPTILVYNGSTQPVHVIVDLVGVIDDDSLTFGAVFHRLDNGVRLVDTRNGTGLPGPIGPAGQANVDPSALTTAWSTVALDTNLTAVRPTSGTFLTLWPTDLSDPTPPTISNVNAGTGQIVPNHAIPVLGDLGLFSVYNDRGTTHVLVDVDGTFDLRLYPGAPGTNEASRSIQIKRRILSGRASAWPSRPTLTWHPAKDRTAVVTP